MRKNRMLMSLIFALSYGAVACGGAGDNSVNDSTASLRGRAPGDAGHASGHTADGDDAAEEALEGDAGRHHDEERGDGGEHHDDDEFRGDGGGDCDRGGDFGGKGDVDGKGGFGGKGGKLSEDGGFHFFGFDGGFPHH